MSEDLLGGRYRLESELGHGGMATVWRGVDTRLDRPVAVKVLEEAAARIDPAAQERFNREAWTIARLTNIHVVRVYDVGVDDRQFLVMELVEGINLADLLASGPLDVDRAIDIAAQVCDALSAAHAVGVVHRDIKPGNILIDDAGTVKLCDFGIARLVGASQSTLTSVGTTIGTSQYMAPEQAGGDAVDARTDLYALGCVLYAMLTGAPPFTGGSPVGIAHQHLTREPEPVAARRPGLPAALADLVGRLLAKNPDDRPQTAAEVRTALESVDPAGPPAAAVAPTALAAAAVRGSAPVVSRTRTMPALDETGGAYPPYPPPQRNWWPIAAAAAVAAVLIVVIAVALLSHNATPNGGSPTGGPSGTADTTATTAAATDTGQSGDPVDALAQVVTEQAAANNIDQDVAQEVGNKLDELRQAQQDGKPGKIAKAAQDVADTLTKAHQDGKITDEGWSAVESVVTRLTGSLSGGGDNANNGDGGNSGD